MTPDNSNISSLFGDITPSSPLPPVQTNDVSGTTSGILAGKQEESTVSPITVPIPTPPPSVPVQTVEISGSTSQSVLSAMQESSIVVPVAPIIPVGAPVVQNMVADLLVSPISEVPSSTIVSSLESPLSQSGGSVLSQATPVLSEDEENDEKKMQRYMEEDIIYQSMLRVVDNERIRLRLAIRYTIVMFAVFLVAAWIVNNRVIMFGFSEFQWLARIRDGLFGLIAGLFSLTLWFGSEVWFRKLFFIIFFRILAIGFFAAVLSALYFPLW
jgi:hypothetical protein